MGSAWGGHWTLAFDIGQEIVAFAMIKNLRNNERSFEKGKNQAFRGHRKKVRAIIFFLLQCPTDIGMVHTSRVTEQAKPKGLPSLSIRR